MTPPDALNAGRELDALVAQKVMGRPVTWLKTALSESAPHVTGESGIRGWHFCPLYSTDIVAAWHVVAWMERGRRNANDGLAASCLESGEPVETYDHWVFALELGPHGGWTASFIPTDPYFFQAKADTAPLAICLAALKVVGVEMSA